MFELTLESARGYLVGRRLAPADAAIELAELPGGVSATVISARVPETGIALVIKQALPQLRVRDEWLATPDRAETEVAAMALCGAITPGVVPAVVDSDPGAHVLVMDLIPPEARNWQAEVGDGRVHPGLGRWAGATLGAWHAATSAEVPAGLDDFEAFEQLRLRPFHETVMVRRPELADEIAPLLAELRHDRRSFVHGDYSLKNMLVGPAGNWVLDFEVAHYGNPVFDLGFFLSFVVLSAVRWEPLTPELRLLGDGFLSGYAEAAGTGLAGDAASVTAHTAALVLARTDGKSPAQFLDQPSRERARAVGTALLRQPEQGLWQWL
jgi:hypothetical protein